MTSWIKRHPVFAFYILAFLFSWLGWVPQAFYARGLFPFDSPIFLLLGGFGPAIAAVIVIAILKGKEGPAGLFRALFQGRVRIIWYATALLGWPLIALIAILLDKLLGGPAPDWSQFGAWTGIIPLFIMNLLSNVWEEIGWRGFALPRLQERYSALAASMIVGSLWWLWHMPLIFNPTNPMSEFPLVPEIVFTLAQAIIYTWLYNNTGGSLLFVTLFHAMSNTVAFSLLKVMPDFGRNYLLTVAVTAGAAVVIVLVYGLRRLSRRM